MGVTRQLLILSLGAALGGCAVGPDYQKQEPQAPAAWVNAKGHWDQFTQAEEKNLQKWWTTFKDPILERLIQRGLKGNLDLKQALARIDQTRAERSAQRALLFPQIGSATFGGYLDNLVPGQTLNGNSLGLIASGFDAFWEIDLVGRLRRKLESASALQDAAREKYQATWSLLAADIARNYTEFRNLQKQASITQRNLLAQKKVLELTQRLESEGVGTRYDVSRARNETETTAAKLPRIESELRQHQHALEVLLGQKPGELAALLTPPRDVPQASDNGLLLTPAQALRLRPDIREAERNLAAATANQGAALAEMFPKISVAAFVGLQNSDLESLFRSKAFSWASGSSIMQPIFNFGRIRAGINLADARAQETLLHYEKTVLEALRETETAMARYLAEQQRQKTLVSATLEAREALRLAQLRYQEGVSNFLEVLDTERVLLGNELALAECEALSTLHLINLYKSLGGAGNLDLPEPDDPLRPWG